MMNDDVYDWDAFERQAEKIKPIPFVRTVFSSNTEEVIGFDDFISIPGLTIWAVEGIPKSCT